jgi:hypothetical protein
MVELVRAKLKKIIKIKSTVSIPKINARKVSIFSIFNKLKIKK